VLAGSHTLEDAVEINVRVLNVLFGSMAEHGVHLDGCILKVNMVNAGNDCAANPYTREAIADANLRTLRRTLPVSVRTVNYLSGGQTLADASARLDAINKMKAARGGDRYGALSLLVHLCALPSSAPLPFVALLLLCTLSPSLSQPSGLYLLSHVPMLGSPMEPVVLLVGGNPDAALRAL
jgi:hypothetical protein